MVNFTISEFYEKNGLVNSGEKLNVDLQIPIEHRFMIYGDKTYKKSLRCPPVNHAISGV